jgi:26S proteasome regulatory subunit T4
MVFNMMNEDPGKVDFGEIGGLGDQLRVLRETVELPLTNPELFKRVGIKPPKGNTRLKLRLSSVWTSRNWKNPYC